MPRVEAASPRVAVHLHKTVTRKTVNGSAPVSDRYANKDGFIDLTPFLNDRSAVRTSKSVREPAGVFSLTFADKAQESIGSAIGFLGGKELESIYALVEPMDMVEIRMWRGLGPAPAPEKYPIVMRGFISDVQRSQAMSDDGKPMRQVVITGQDYGKIWQIYQVIHLLAYAERIPLLTNFGLWEMFGLKARNAMLASAFVKTMIEKIINPHLAALVPDGMPKELKLDISVAHGVVNNSYQQSQGSIYDILRTHGDVGIWNELYTEDREDGVYVVYRPIPALHMGTDKLIQDDAPKPVYCEIEDTTVQSLSVSRTDSTVANFYWVNNSKFDVIDDIQRKLQAIPKDDGRVVLRDYPNSAIKYYGIRPMYGETQQGDERIVNMTTGQDQPVQDERRGLQEAWIDKRRRIMMEMNRDNVVFERGSATVKGGPMRPGGLELMRAGDYGRFLMGTVTWRAYCVQIDHDFRPFNSYTTNVMFERGEGFAVRAQMGAGSQTPYLAEMATRS